MCILAQCAFTVSVSIDNRLDKRVNIEHDDREQFSLIFQFLTLFKIFQKAQLLKKKEMMVYYLHHVVFLRTCLYTLWQKSSFFPKSNLFDALILSAKIQIHVEDFVKIDINHFWTKIWILP